MAENSFQSDSRAAGTGKVLVIDDSAMLLNFAEEILSDANFRAVTAMTGEEGLRFSESEMPDLILLDHMLPDLEGDEVCRRLLENPVTEKIPVVFMSGLGADIQSDQITNSNVVGFLSKPFTSETLTEIVEKHTPRVDSAADENVAAADQPSEETQQDYGDEPVSQEHDSIALGDVTSEGLESDLRDQADASEIDIPETGTFFCGDTNFFSLHSALQAIAREKLTGTLWVFWKKEPVELLAQDGQIMLVTSRDPNLYCPDPPVTLVNVDEDRIAEARERQKETSCPLFISLAREDLIVREPALQLAQHYGQKLFAQLWTARRVRFVFEKSAELPDFARDVSGDPDVDQWALTTLRLTQYQELGDVDPIDPASIPAYTRDGFMRVHNLGLTVAEAQFASQFNGTRSVMQIAKNLRLDLKFALLTLFRFLKLEIVECWPASTAPKQEKRGIFQRLADSAGFGK